MQGLVWNKNGRTDVTNCDNGHNVLNISLVSANVKSYQENSW